MEHLCHGHLARRKRYRLHQGRFAAGRYASLGLCETPFLGEPSPTRYAGPIAGMVEAGAFSPLLRARGWAARSDRPGG